MRRAILAPEDRSGDRGCFSGIAPPLSRSLPGYVRIGHWIWRAAIWEESTSYSRRAHYPARLPSAPTTEVRGGGRGPPGASPESPAKYGATPGGLSKGHVGIELTCTAIYRRLPTGAAGGGVRKRVAIIPPLRPSRKAEGSHFQL